MPSQNEIVYDIMETIRGNQLADDTDIDERHVVYLLNQQRALWISNEYSKPGKHLNEEIIQDLGCVELELADPADCCSISLDCKILRTKQKIPTTINLHNRQAITRVGAVDKLQIPFTYIPYARVPYIGKGKYSQNDAVAYVFLLNDRLHIMSANDIINMSDYINVRGIFENPEDASTFEVCAGQPCFSKDDPYPINARLVPYIKEQVLNQFGIALKIPKDSSNDATEMLNRQ